MARIQTLTKTKLSVGQTVVAGIAITCAVTVMAAFGASGLNAFSRYRRVNNNSVVRLDLVQDELVMPSSIMAGSETPILRFRTDFNKGIRDKTTFTGDVLWKASSVRLYFKSGSSAVIGKATFKLVDSQGNILDSVRASNRAVFFRNINQTIRDGDYFSVIVVADSDIGEAEFTARLYGSYLILSDPNKKPLRYRYGSVRSKYMKIESIDSPLIVSIDSGENINIAPGARNAKVATISLSALVGAGEEVRVNEVQVELQSNGLSHDLISNLKIFDDGSELILSRDPNPISSTDGIEIITLAFRDPLIIISGESKKLDIHVDLSASANQGSFVFAMSEAAVTKIESSAFSLTGIGPVNEVAIEENGKLFVSRNSEYYLYDAKWLNGNTNGVDVGKFDLTASGSEISVESLSVDIGSFNGGGTDELSAIYLYDNSIKIAEGVLTSSNQMSVLFNFVNNPVDVGQDQTKTLTIKVDTAVIANDGTPTNATAVQGFTPAIDPNKIVAKSSSSGQDVDIEGGYIQFSAYGLVKSQPRIVISSTGDSIMSNGEYDLIDVSVTADSKGPVGFYKMTFKVTTTTVRVSEYQVYENGTLVATESSTASGDINVSHINGSSPHQLVEVYFNLNNSLGGRLRQIAAGSTKTYTLKASVNWYMNGYSNRISTSMLGDAQIASAVYNKNAAGVDATDHDNFIWSDLSYGNTSTTATAIKQWLNGFMLDISGGLVSTTSSAKSI
jgi:hypothetical protein